MTCPLCTDLMSPTGPYRIGEEPYTDEDGVTAHSWCHDMDRSSMFGDWISNEYWR